MKRLCIVVATTGLLAVGAPVAQAHPNFDYLGKCGFVVANDVTPGGVFGGSTVWNGIVTAAVVATREDRTTPAPTAPISVDCKLKINGTSQATILSARLPGVGIAAGAGRLTFNADIGDVVELCEEVVVAGEAHSACHTATTTQVVPEAIIDLNRSLLFWFVDPFLCPALRPLAPGIPGVIDVDPTDSDVSVLGERLYDCAPYTTWHPNPYFRTTVMIA